MTMAFKPMFAVTSAALAAVGLVLKQNLDAQKRSVEELEMIRSLEAKSQLYVPSVCRLDVVRECETPPRLRMDHHRLLPSSLFLFDNLFSSPLLSSSSNSLFSTTPEDELFDDIVRTFMSPFRPVLMNHHQLQPMTTSTTWLIISDSEPSLGYDREDNQPAVAVAEQADPEPQVVVDNDQDEVENHMDGATASLLRTGTFPRMNEDVTQIARRRRLTEEDDKDEGCAQAIASRRAAANTVPSPCLQRAYREQRVSQRCSAAIQQLEDLRAQKKQRIADLYQASQRQTQQMMVLYGMAFGVMVFLYFSTSSSSNRYEEEEEDDSCTWLEVVTHLLVLVAFGLLAAALAVSFHPAISLSALITMFWLVAFCLLSACDNNNQEEVGDCTCCCCGASSAAAAAGGYQLLTDDQVCCNCCQGTGTCSEQCDACCGDHHDGCCGGGGGCCNDNSTNNKEQGSGSCSSCADGCCCCCSCCNGTDCCSGEGCCCCSPSSSPSEGGGCCCCSGQCCGDGCCCGGSNKKNNNNKTNKKTMMIVMEPGKKYAIYEGVPIQVV